MSNKQVYPAPVQPSLPQGWQLYVDGQGRPFYWNHFTKQSSWTPPPVAQPQPQQFPQPNYYAPAPTSSNIVSNNLPPGWEQSVDNEGRTYYIDHKNKTTSWHPPQTQTASGSSNPYQSISSTVAAPQSGAPQPMSTMYPMSVPMPMPIQPSVLPSQPNQFYGSPPLASSGIAMGTSPSGSSSWQQNYGMSGYVNPVNVPLLCCSKPSWDTNKEETHCSRCNLEFTFFKRRHHCRCCFRGYCDTCSTKRSAVPQFGHTAAQRVCDSCFGHLSRKENECVSRLIPYMFLVTPSLTNTATSTNAISAIPTLPKELPQAIKEILQLVVAHQHSQTLAKAFNDDILSSNCIPPIVDLLQNHLSRLSQEEIEQLFAIVSHLSTDNALLDSLITTNCLPAVVNILKKSTQDANNLTITTDLRTKGCTFLRNIAVVEKYRETLRQSRAIEVIIDCIGCATGEAIELGQISSHAVNLLTSPGNANSEQTTSNNDMLLYIGQLSNATTNMLVLLSSSHDIKTLQYITESLSNLATIEKNKDTMEDLGVVMTLISLLSSKESKRPIEIPAILINVLKCVFELTRKLNNTSCDTLAQSHEAMESLLTLFNTLDDDLILLNVNILTNLERFCNAGNRRTVSNILLSGVNLSAMLKFAESHNLQLQIAALELIATATSNVEAQSSSLDNIRNSGGIQCLVRIISSAPTYLHQTSSQTPSQPGILSQGQSYEHIVYIALQLTCRLVESNLQNAVTLLEVGGVSILADLMLDTNLVESIRVQILFVLCATSKYGNLVEVMPLSGNMQFMQILSQLMKHNSVEIVLSVLNLLCNMAILQDNRLAIHKSGCMNNIVGLLDISNEPIQLGCLTLITSLCSSVGQAPDDVVRDSMAELGVIAPIVSLLRSSNSNIEKQAALALKHACRSYVNREHIIAIGALSPLTKLLANESLKNIESRVHLAEILAAFSAEEKARTVMKESDGISIFIELLFSQDDPLQLNATIALSNFALSQADADVIHKNGGALAIMGLIDKAHSVGIQESAILALGNLASHSQCREDIVQAIVSQADSGSQMNAIKYLLFLMNAAATQSEQSDLVSVQLRPRAIWCLSMLSMNESLANYLSLIYAMPLVGQALLACADVNTTEYQQLVFIILNLCRNNDTNWNTLVETSGVPLLLLLCQNNIWEAQIKSLNSLASLSQRQDCQEQILTSSVGISTLVSMLKSPNDAIKSSTIVIFSNISHFQQAWKVLNDNIGDIVGALSSKEPVVQFSVSVVLKNLASHTDNWKHIIDCGAVPRLIELLFNSEERLQIVTVEILCSLSNDETIANLIHSYGGVLALITLLSAPNDTLKEIVTLTLANLCKVSAICCDTVITNDGLEPIIPLLSSPNNKLQVNALFIVGKLSSNPNFCNLIEIHGGLPPLLALIRPSQPDESTGSRKPFGDVESQVLDTLLNISVHSEKNRQAIVGAGGLPILLGLVEPPSLDPFQTIPFAITALVLNVLANLVMDDFTKRAVRELEGISRITQTFLSFSAKTSSTDSAKDVLAILQQALRAIYFLSIDDSNCAVICPATLQAVTGLLRETTSRDLIIQSLKLCKVFGAYASNHTAIQNTELIGGVVIPLINSTSLDDRDTQFHLIDLLTDLAFLDSAQNGDVLRAYGGLQAVAHTLTSQHEDVVVPSLMLLSRLVIQDANRKILRDVLEPQVLVFHCSSVNTLVKRLAYNLKQTLFG